MNPPPIPPGDPSALPVSESVAAAIPVPSPVRRRSRLALVAFLLALLAVPGAAVAVAVLFGAIWTMPGEEAQVWVMLLLVSTVLGFLAALLGSIPMVRMRGRDPELRGRGLALFAVAGPRGVLFGSGLAFGAIWFAGQIGGDPDVLRDGGRTLHLSWAVVLVLVAWYLTSSIRRVRTELRSPARGWLLYSFGVLAHLGLIVGFPFCIAGAFFTLHRNEMFVGQDPNMPPPASFGSYAQRELWFDLPSRAAAKATVRRWHQGRSSDLGTLNLSGTNRVRWILAETSPQGPHSIDWRFTSGGEGGGSGTFEAPPELTLVPTDTRNSLVVPPGLRTNLWLFLPLGSDGPGAEKEGIELVLEPSGR